MAGVSAGVGIRRVRVSTGRCKGEGCRDRKNDFTKKINLSVKTKKNNLVIEIKNHGIKPAKAKTLGRLPKKIRPGGLGVFFMKKIMDKVEYDTKATNVTRLIMSKKIPNKKIAS